MFKVSDFLIKLCNYDVYSVTTREDAFNENRACTIDLTIVSIIGTQYQRLLDSSKSGTCSRAAGMQNDDILVKTC